MNQRNPKNINAVKICLLNSADLQWSTIYISSYWHVALVTGHVMEQGPGELDECKALKMKYDRLTWQQTRHSYSYIN